MQDFKKAQKVNLTFKISPIRSYEFSCIIKRIEFDRLILSFPKNRKDIIKYLREGTELHAVVYTDSGLYVFDSIVIDSPFNIDFVIELPEETTRIQHRSFERASICLKLKLIRNKKMVKTTTVNIGGGGIRFRVNDFFENNHIWNFVLYMPTGEAIIGYGEIIYSLKDGFQNVSILKFSDIGEPDRSRIIKLIYDEEIKSLKANEKSG